MHIVGTAQRGHAALRRGRISLPNQVYHVTNVIERRQAVFASFDAACAAAGCFTDRTSLGDARLLAWVLMPDHAHWLLQLGPRDGLAVVVDRMKARSACAANRVSNGHGRLWARGYHDHALRSDEDLAATARYIIANPVRAGIVVRVGDYPFWDAIWL